MLSALLAGHRELRAEAERLARVLVARDRPEDVASAVEQAVLGVDLDQLAERSGRKSWGYVEPSEAAWATLEEAVEPFFADVKRLVALGLEAPAVQVCAGIVRGLYAVRGVSGDGVLAYADGFPAEMAGHAVATLARESTRVQGRRWLLPDGFFDKVPEWRSMLSRAGRGR